MASCNQNRLDELCIANGEFIPRSKGIMLSQVVSPEVSEVVVHDASGKDRAIERKDFAQTPVPHSYSTNLGDINKG